MNCKIKKTLFGLHLSILLIVLMIIALASPPRANAQISAGTIGTATNLPATVATGVAVSKTSVIPVYKNSGLALQWKFKASAGTTNAVLLIYPSVDGTNFATVPWTWVATANGTTSVIATTNWSPPLLAGIVALNLGGMTNANSGTLTNQGVIFNRPN